MDLDYSNHDLSLFEAVLNEDFKEAAFLLNIGANPNRIMSEQGGVSSFHIAVGLQNDLKFTRLFLNHLANVNIKSEKEGWTPLHVCAFWNKFESLQLLLLNRADVTIKDKKGKTAEQVALENKSLKCLRILRDFSSLNSETYSTHYYENKSVELPSTADYCSIDLTESVLNDPTVKKSLASTTFNIPSKQATVKRPSEQQRTPKKKEKSLKPKIDSDNLEKLIDDLIDRKLNALKLTPTSSSIISPSISSSKVPDVVPLSTKSNNLTPKSYIQKESTTNQSQKRFHSPEKLPHFYAQSPTRRSIIDETIASNSLSRSVANSPSSSPCLVTKETQTNAKLIRVKQILRRSREASSERLESLKPNVAKLKGWLSKVVNSPGGGTPLSKEKAVDDDGSPQPSRYQTVGSSMSLSASSQASKRMTRRDEKYNDAETVPINLKKRSSSLVSSNTLTTTPRTIAQPHVDELYSSVFKTDRFPSKSTLNSKYQHEMSQKVYVSQKTRCEDGPIKIVENKKLQFDSPSRYNFKTMCHQPIIHHDFNSSLLTNDESTIIINENDIFNSTKKSSVSTYRTAPDNINDYMEMIESDYEEQQTEELKKRQQRQEPVDLEIELSRALEKQDDEGDESEEEKVASNESKTMNNQNNQSIINKKTKLQQNGFSNELIEELISKLNMTQASDVIEANMFNSFKQNCEWREGNVKSAFNYLLIDPRVTQNLPLRAKKLSENQVFNIFISGIFYIGKGSRARPYAHLHDSLKYWKTNNNNNKSDSQSTPTQVVDVSNIKSKKIKKIIEIWQSNHGIVSLHCFQSVIPSEAYTREAAMIDAIGLGHLTNMKKGNYYGIAKEWSDKRKKELGTVLLRRACAIFLGEGERQIYPTDI